MFLTKTDLQSALYTYQIEQISEGDDSIVYQAINAAVEMVKSYLSPSAKKEWLDGRPLYDVNAIFSATGTDRNPLILSHCVSVATWFFVELSNPDVRYDDVQNRYDRAVSYLKQLSRGEVVISSLPVLAAEDTAELANNTLIMGSRPKFNHE